MSPQESVWQGQCFCFSQQKMPISHLSFPQKSYTAVACGVVFFDSDKSLYYAFAVFAARRAYAMVWRGIYFYSSKFQKIFDACRHSDFGYGSSVLC